jgi:hypothetical protein
VKVSLDSTAMVVMMILIIIILYDVFDQSVLKQGPRTDEVGGEGELGQHGHGSDDDIDDHYSL